MVPRWRGHVNLEHARVGKKVRVRADRRHPEMRGPLGGVTDTLGGATSDHRMIGEGEQQAVIGAFLLAHEGHTREVEVQLGAWGIYCRCRRCGDIHTYEVDNEARGQALNEAMEQAMLALNEAMEQAMLALRAEARQGQKLRA